MSGVAHFFAEIFANVKKIHYLCTRFSAGNNESPNEKRKFVIRTAEAIARFMAQSDIRKRDLPNATWWS